jgi:RimJ/RimL family protein N-acetyltransferase
MKKLPARTENQDEVAPRTVLVPPRTPIAGTRVVLEPLDPRRHAQALYAAGHEGEDAAAIWDYLPYGPFADADAYGRWLADAAGSLDPVFYTVVPKDEGRASGVLSFLNVVPKAASIEIGHIWFAPFLQRTPAATEALFLSMRHAFDDLGYRRLEWKCNACNAKSRAAALRLGFAFEGVFYRHMIAKGRNRDTAWFSLLDEEWPLVRTCFESWLERANFDDDGRQKTSLGELTRALRP